MVNLVQLRGVLRRRLFDKKERLKREEKQLKGLRARAKFTAKERSVRDKIAIQEARISKAKGESKTHKAFRFGLKLGKELLKERKKRLSKRRRTTTKRRTTKRTTRRRKPVFIKEPFGLPRELSRKGKFRKNKTTRKTTRRRKK